MRESIPVKPTRTKLGKLAVWLAWGLWIGALAFLAFLVFGCSTPTSGDKTRKVYVVNSLWQVVKTDIISREIVGDDLEEEVEAYNAVTLDDFLRIYYDTLPDLSNAPPVSVFICNPVTYEVNWSMENVPRQSLVDNAAAWRQDAAGQILFIDHVPPPPVIEPPLDPYAYWALYAVDNDTGAIVYEDHCGYREDRQFYQEDIGDYPSVPVYYAQRLAAFNSIAVVIANNVHVVTRQLYTPPTP